MADFVLVSKLEDDDLSDMFVARTNAALGSALDERATHCYAHD